VTEKSHEGAGWDKFAVDAVSGALGASIGLLVAGPPGAILGGVTPAVFSRSLELVRNVRSRRQQARAAFVIAGAAKLAGLDPDEVVRRLERDEVREEVLIRTLRAAQDAALMPKLLGLAHSLASSCTTDSDAELNWESSFVAAIADCDHRHLQVLRAFQHPMVPLDLAALRAQLPEGDALIDPALAILERHGLIRGGVRAGGIMAVRVGPEDAVWTMTSFGGKFLQRMTDIAETLKQEVAS
jgi:hypothetical protein